MQLNLGAIFLALLGVMATMAPSVLSEPHRHQGPIFDTRPSPFNPNQPRQRPGVY
ncbi:metchnikowin [Drosophila takahashii]|uniref:metchnikowin n=1 Tax=Drosophila takahashii TaxID=29030 RepID=UPI001CF80DF0|nr:metchnikowin [Drosophila takahashii]